MTPVLKNLDLGSHIGFDEFVPDDAECFSVWITATVGPLGEEGGEQFQIRVCTPLYLKGEVMGGQAVWGRHALIVERYDPRLIRTKIETYLDRCRGDDWTAVAERVARIGLWEFEDYCPHPG